MEDLGTDSVLRVLLNHELAMACFEPSLSALPRNLFASEGLANRAADAFIANGGCRACLRLLATATLSDALARDTISVLSLWLKHAKVPAAANAFTDDGGLDICLSLLDKARLVLEEGSLFLDKDSMQAVKGVLSLLEAWSDKSTNAGCAFWQRPGLSSLLPLLTARDWAIADPASVLVSWALHYESRDRPELAIKMGDDAIKSLLHFLARSPKDTKYALGAYERLITALVPDEKWARRFPVDDVLKRLLGVFKDKHSSYDMLVGGASCVEILATRKKSVAIQLLIKKFPSLLVDRLVAEDISDEDFEKNRQIMAAVNAILLWAADSEKAKSLDIQSVETLLKVKRPPISSPLHTPRSRPFSLASKTAVLARYLACLQQCSLLMLFSRLMWRSAVFQNG